MEKSENAVRSRLLEAGKEEFRDRGFLKASLRAICKKADVTTGALYFFFEKVLGERNADTVDVYEALDMFLPGMFAYRSILAGGIPMEIPNLRNKAEREKWRHDTACTDPAVAGEMLLPTFSRGTPEIDDGVYAHMKALYEAEREKK